MLDRMQHITGLPGEVGVLKKHLDGKLYLVGNSLPPRLVTGPKFKILYVVVRAISVFVMDTFVFGKRTAQVLSHNFAMDKYFFTSAFMQADVAGRVLVTFGIDRAPSTSFPPAVFATKFLSAVKTGGTTFFVKALTVVRNFSAQLALKSEWQFDVHVGHLASPATGVKEII